MTEFTLQALLFLCILGICCVLISEPIMNEARLSAEQRKKEREFHERRSMISGEPKVSKVERMKGQFIYSLELIHMPSSVFRLLEAGCLIIGFFFGKMILTRTGLAIFMSLLFALFPVIFVSVRASWYKQKEMAQLENCMVMITSTYRATKDIVGAIQENIDKPSMPVAFRSFLSDVSFVDSSVEKALRKIAVPFNNYYFTEWINALIKSQYDSTMIDILPSIIDEMDEAKKAQNESSRAMKAVWREYVIWIISAICVPLILKLNDQWYNALVNTPIGKGLLIGMMLG